MLELNLGPSFRHLPYTIRLYDVTEEMFDEIVDEDTKAEYIDGVMIVHSPASFRHDDVSGLLRFLMRGFASSHQLGKVLGPDSLVRLPDSSKYAPDIFFVPAADVPIPSPKVFDGVPALIVEVLSPSNHDEDLEIKRPRYRAAGVAEIWFVDPDSGETIVDRKRGKRHVTKTTKRGKVTSSVLPGFWFETAWLAQEPLPNEMSCLRQILDDGTDE
ncbi:MAG: Uma2 family endonuclease [Gemmataceae bacterium]